MVFLLMCTLPLAMGTLDATSNEVLTATQTILMEKGLSIKDIINDVLTTEYTGINLATLDYYISDDQPDDNPGWFKARYYTKVVLNKITNNQTEILVESFFERFGVRSAFVLIPQAWTAVPSNDLLEEEIIEAVEKKLTGN